MHHDFHNSKLFMYTLMKKTSFSFQVMTSLYTTICVCFDVFCTNLESSKVRFGRRGFEFLSPWSQIYMKPRLLKSKQPSVINWIHQIKINQVKLISYLQLSRILFFDSFIVKWLYHLSNWSYIFFKNVFTIFLNHRTLSLIYNFNLVLSFNNNAYYSLWIVVTLLSIQW